MPHVSLDSDAAEGVYPHCVQNASKPELIGIRRERSKARRPRPTVKLDLESLTERILPSASPVVPPTVADVTSQMVSTLDQLAHQIVTVQNDLNSAWMALAQEVMANAQQQWDHLLGIDPNPQNQSQGAIVQQPGSGGDTGKVAVPTAPEATSASPSNPTTKDQR